MNERDSTSFPHLSAFRAMGRPDEPRFCDEMQDLAPAFALGALEPSEAGSVEHHVAACPGCAALLAEFERTASLLPFLARRALPAPDLKAALFTRIAQTDESVRRLGPVRTAAPARARISAVRDLPETSPTIPASRAAPAAEGAGRRSPWANLTANLRRRSMPLPTAIPFVLALALVGGWGYSMYDQAKEADADRAWWNTVSGVLSADNGTVYDLSSTVAMPNAEGSFIASPDGTQGVLMVQGLTASSGRTYQVWIEQDGQMVQLDDLKVNDKGEGTMRIQIDGTFKRCRGLYIHATNGSNTSVLWATLSSPNPTLGGDDSPGEQPVGTDLVSASR